MSQSVMGKRCACCVYWCGKREDRSHMSSGSVLAEDSQGRCSCSRASHNDYNKNVGATHNCPMFERWTKR